MTASSQQDFDEAVVANDADVDDAARVDPSRLSLQWERQRSEVALATSMVPPIDFVLGESFLTEAERQYQAEFEVDFANMPTGSEEAIASVV